MSESIAPPSLREELNRKVVETLEEYVGKVEAKRLTPADGALAGKVIWTLTAGLVDEGVSRMAAAVADSSHKPRMEQHFVKGTSAVSVFWFADRTGYVVNRRDTVTGVQKPTVMRTEIGPREAELNEFFNKLATAGYFKL